MKQKTKQILEIWHKHFEDEEKQYSEFESSDIEYFVACMLYNHFAFSKALATMKTMDLSYDFISSCDEEYDEIQAIVKSIEFADEIEKLVFLQNFIKESQEKYTRDECYLLDRIAYHIDSLSEQYNSGEIAKRVDFIKPDAPNPKSANPLLR